MTALKHFSLFTMFSLNQLLDHKPLQLSMDVSLKQFLHKRVGRYVKFVFLCWLTSRKILMISLFPLDLLSFFFLFKMHL